MSFTFPCTIASPPTSREFGRGRPGPVVPGCVDTDAPLAAMRPRPGLQLAAGLASVLALCAGAATALAQDAPLAPFIAEYEVQRNGKAVGSSRMTLVRQGGDWTYRSVTEGERGMASLLGLRIEQSMDFAWHDGLPRPTRSRYRQEATLGNRSVDVDYDWQANRYRLVDRKGEHNHALVAGTVDRYGSGVAVAARLAAGDREFALKVAYPDGVRDWRFEVTGTESVTTPAGTVQAIRVERVRDAGDDDRSTTSWHDPQRGFIAVRMLQTEDGDSTETLLRSYTPG
jgi:hypothetical protein